MISRHDAKQGKGQFANKTAHVSHAPSKPSNADAAAKVWLPLLQQILVFDATPRVEVRSHTGNALPLELVLHQYLRCQLCRCDTMMM
jgi:hypothetical protein